MGKYVTIIWGIPKKVKNGKCVICGSKFDNPENFPEDFPDEWKMCCLCYFYALDITKAGSAEEVINSWLSVIKAGYEKIFAEKLMKIEKLIKMV